MPSSSSATSGAAPTPVHYDVAIVGYGPVGATLTNLLAEQGLRVLVLEREADIYALPRAVHFDGECMRVFQAAGIAPALEPHVLPIFGMRFVNPQGQMLIDWQRPLDVGPQGWYASYRFHQPQLEALLRQRAAERDGVDVRLRHEVFAIDEFDDHVVIRFEDMRNGKLWRASASHVVGCDGARSLVRRLIGTELDDLQSHERWLVIDAILERPRPDLGDDSIQHCDPARPATYVRGVGDRRRWELMLLPHEDPAVQTQPERIWQMLSRWITPADARLERHAVYTFHSVVARGWRRGRLLIAGDAAHQTPPFLGQGMCAGIRDVSNLAWKLTAVVQGRAPDAWLDTYESERSPHVREFIATAVRLGRVIQTLDPERARERDAAMAAQPERFTVPQPSLGDGLHDASPLAGTLALQPRAADGGRLDDTLGSVFVIYALPDVADAVRHWARGRVAVHALAADESAWLQDHGQIAALVRPDRHVAGTVGALADLHGFNGWLTRPAPAGHAPAVASAA